MNKRVHHAGLGLWLMSLAAPAWAACTGNALESSITAQQLNEIRPARDATVGSVIHTIRINDGPGYAKCQGGEPFTYGFVQNMAAIPIQGLTRVYPSGIPGIGVRIFWPHEGGVYFPSPMTPPRALSNYQYRPPQDFTIDFVKTGTIQSGTIGNLNVEVKYGALVANRLKFMGLRYEAKVRSCLPDQFEQQVEMPSIRARDLGQVGATAGPKPFAIKLSCDADLKVAYRIDSPGQKNNVIPNADEDGMAKGVGVQLFKGDASSNAVQLLETRTEVETGSSPGLPFGVLIPLTARYYQTASEVTAGKVSATATVTFFYE